MHIMIVEDEPLLLKAITEKCSRLGLNVYGHLNGKEALIALRDKTEIPDVVWLDYYLPDINGYEFMQEFNRLKPTPTAKVMVVSNSTSPEKVGELIKLGVREYILKAEHRLEDIIERAKQLAH